MLEIPDHALSLDDDLSVAIRAAAKAGEVIIKEYGKPHQIDEKGVGDLVTPTDRVAQKVILDELRRARPRDKRVFEEKEKEEESSPSNTYEADEAGRCWFVDPLDATSAFIFEAGEDLPSVMIALRDEGVTRVGVVLFPLTSEYFYAISGGGAYKNGACLSTANRKAILKKAWIDMNQYGDVEFETRKFARLRRRLRSEAGAKEGLVTSQAPHSGIAVRIAEGKRKISAVIHDNNKKKVKQQSWDVAAPQLILEEAGGVFVNFSGERYNLFNPEPLIATVSLDFAMQILRLI